MKQTLMKPLNVAFVATYPPRQCGIGTFTADLVNGIKQLYGSGWMEQPQDNLQVVSLNNLPHGYKFPPEVRFEIRDQHRGDYREAADFLNLSPTDVVCLQHEFGIFGGEDGNYVLHLLNNLKKPVVTTLHTVISQPSPNQREVLKTICSLSTLLVVQAQKAVEILMEVYGVPREKIWMIHHGAPDVPFLDSSYYKDQFQAEGRRLILTFGLLNPNKGIEFAIQAMPKVVERYPEVLYLILGATHPEVKRRWGEEYRLSLERMVRERGLEKHVIFHNRFVTLERLIQFLVATDIYLTPYLSKEQIVSGTLAYAVACGKAIISTPYWYAEELLAEGRGYLVPFRDSQAIAERLIQLLEDEPLRNRLRKQAYQFGRQMVWREVAGAYAQIFERALLEYGKQARSARMRHKVIESPMLPEINLHHLRTMTDDTGLLQHALFTTPDRYHGYCTDDNARAVLVAVMNWHMFQDEGILPLLQVYLAFLNHALHPETNRVRNFMSFDRRWLEEVGSEDSHGRTVWAMGYTVAHAPTNSILGLATRLFKQAIRPCLDLSAPRAWAYSVLGSLSYLQRFNGDTEAKAVAVKLSRRLLELFEKNISDDWLWFEDIVTYDNARLPQTLISAGHQLGDQKMLKLGLKVLDWLLYIQTHPKDGHLSLIGNKGWYRRGKEKARFDQQPIEVAGLIDACYQAYQVTGESRWKSIMERCFNWFFGRNDVHQSLYDFSTGGCYDGLHPGGVNQNQGGESTVCWLLAVHTFYQVAHEESLQ